MDRQDLFNKAMGMGLGSLMPQLQPQPEEPQPPAVAASMGSAVAVAVFMGGARQRRQKWPMVAAPPDQRSKRRISPITRSKRGP